MVETNIETHKTLSLIDQARDINKDTILAFTEEYLKSHAYISSKKLTMAFIYEYYNLTHSSMDYDKIKRILYNKFTPAITSFRREGLIAVYSTTLYKRVNNQSS